MLDRFLRGCAVPEDWQRLTAHPKAELFPLMEDAELAELKADIEKNDLQEEIILYEGQILDGRNRHAACLQCEFEPRFVEFIGDDPLAFIVSKNLRRRHLSQAAKAEIVTKLLKETPCKADRAIGGVARVDGVTTRKCSECTTSGTLSELRPPVEIAGRYHA